VLRGGLTNARIQGRTSLQEPSAPDSDSLNNLPD
jgi:hypothetical protein